MYETKEKTKNVCEMREYLENHVKPKLMSSDCCMSVADGREFIDMIKDLAEAEEKLWKACYYKKIVEGMSLPTIIPGDSEHDDIMGYDNWRYSSGRFAPTGHGHRSGYTPDEGMTPGFMDKMMRERDGYARMNPHMPHMGSHRYGYDPMEHEDDRYGQAYHKWMNSRKGYTASGSQADKMEMDHHAKEHMADTMLTLREIWKDSDNPELKKKLKADLTVLLNEMV